jgi:predicted PurR-regulated permease PerM
VILATIASIWALQWGAAFFIPCAVAICLTLWLMPLVDVLHRFHLPRSVGAGIVLLGLISSVAFTGYMLRDDARGFAASLPKATSNARALINDASRDPNGIIHHLRGVFTDRPTTRVRVIPDPVETRSEVQAAFWRTSTTAMSAAASVIVVLFTIYLMLMSGDMFKRKLMTVVSMQAQSGTLTRKRITIEIINEIEAQFQRYLGVLAVTNIVIGLLTWGAFTMLGVEHAAVWGVAAAVLHIIPYVGPAVITAAALLVAALQFDSLSHALVVSATVLTIFGIIGMWFQTWLSGRASNMNPVAVFVGLMFWGWLWGIWGLFLGTPLMMALKVVADRVECLNWLGTFLAGAPKKERKVALETAKHSESAPIAATAPAAAAVVTEAAVETIAIEKDTRSDADVESKNQDAPSSMLPAIAPA